MMVASITYIEKVISVLTQATEANWRTPGREGNVVVLSPDLADELMVTGDLHGHLRNFNLIRRIASLRGNPRRHLLLQEVCHGGSTYSPGGGCTSHTMLEDVARWKVEFPERVHFILGNHELAEMSDYPIQKNRQMLNVLFQKGLEHMYGASTDRVRRAMLAFLESCPLAVRLPWGAFISHSVPEGVDSQGFDMTVFSQKLGFAMYMEQGPLFRMVWGRDYRAANARAFAEMVEARILINGHEPCAAGFAVPNPHQIILDCCGENACYAMLPTDRQLTQAEVVARIARLA